MIETIKDAVLLEHLTKTYAGVERSDALPHLKSASVQFNRHCFLLFQKGEKR